MAKPRMEDPREAPDDDPRQQTDWPTHKQTINPGRGIRKKSS